MFQSGFERVILVCRAVSVLEERFTDHKIVDSPSSVLGLLPDPAPRIITLRFARSLCKIQPRPDYPSVHRPELAQSR